MKNSELKVAKLFKYAFFLAVLGFALPMYVLSYSRIFEVSTETLDIAMNVFRGSFVTLIILIPIMFYHLKKFGARLT